MAGYYGYAQMSNNAVDAYERGLKPKSKWTKEAILDEICNDIFDSWTLAQLRELLIYSEWHHTGGAYARTKFYEINQELVDYYIEHPDERPEVEKVEKKKQTEVEEGYYHGKYKCTEFHPTSMHRKYKEWYESFKNGRKKGAWIILPDGRRKKFDNCIIEKITKTKRRK